MIPQVLENNVLHGRHFSEWLNELVPHPFVSVEFDCNLSFEQEILAVSEKKLDLIVKKHEKYMQTTFDFISQPCP